MSELALRLIAENKITKAPFLDLGNCGLENYLPEELLDCVWLEELNLGVFYDSGNGLKESENRATPNKFWGKQLNTLEKLTKLKSLSLNKCQVFDIHSLEKLTGLEKLDLSNNQLSDIKPLEKLTGLEKLYLKDNQLSDIKPLEKLTALQTLHLSNNQLSDIKPLEKLTGLEKLYLKDNQLSDSKLLEKLTALQTLNLSNNQLSDIKPLEKLTDLQILHLSFNQLSDIKPLEKLTGLQYLDLSFNQLSGIKPLEKLTGLQYLDLGYNQISDFQSLEKLLDLRKLCLDSCELSDIHFLDKLTSLQTLNLSENKLSDIHFLEKLIGLQTLDLSENQLSDIQLLGKLTNLQALNLRHNSISDIHFLENLTCLKILDLCANRISNFQSLEKLTGLRTLYLSRCELSDIHFIGKLIGLRSLYLSGNQLSDIHFIGKLIGLRSLYLSSNQLSDIQSLGNLVGLQELDLSNNQLSDIQSLENLVGLQELDLSNNQLLDIQSLEKLTYLKKIYFSHNKVSDIAWVKRLCSFSAIEKIDFTGNQLALPDGLDLSDISVLRSYFKDGEAGVTNKRSVKLLFMGDGCAGKSTLYQHLKTGVPPQEIAVNDRTHGIALDVWSGVLPDIEVRVWDFGGQDVFHSTHRLFLGQGAIYVVVWTKQANKKCTQGEQHPLRYWLDFIAEYGKNSRVLLVENTIDGQFDSTEFPDDTTLEQLAEEYNEEGIYLDTSLHRIDCKYDTRKVKSLKKMLEGEIEQLVEDFPIKDFPANWYAVQQRLEQLKLVHKTIVWEDYQAICDQENISDATALVKYLDRSGVVSYYPDLFEQQVILQTDWILEAMYAFLQLENNPIARQGGKLREEDFRIVWGTNYTEDEQALFKSYMLKSEVMARPLDDFELEIQRDYEYLIPALFKSCKAHEKINWANELHYIAIQFKFVYLAIIQRLQVKILTHCHVEEEESFYNNRISFTDKVGRTAHIELLVEEKELRIHAEHEDLYRDILTELNTIYPLDRLKVIERIKGQEDKEIDYRKMQHGKEYGFEKKGFLNEKEEDKKAPQQSMTMIETDKTPEIFFSYAWGDSKEVGESRELIINELYESLKNDKYNVIRDKVDLGYKGSILSFMERIGKGDVVVVALSDKYFKSPYCMFELYEVYRNAKFEKKEFVKSIFPIRVESIALGDPKVLREYLNHWKIQKEEKEALIKDFLAYVDEESHKEYRRVNDIYTKFFEMVTILKDMNLLNKEILSQDNFAEIKNAIIAQTKA